MRKKSNTYQATGRTQRKSHINPITKNTTPIMAKPILASHNAFRLVMMDMAPMAMATWNNVTHFANTECLAL
jgi:hypothetical protein